MVAYIAKLFLSQKFFILNFFIESAILYHKKILTFNQIYKYEYKKQSMPIMWKKKIHKLINKKSQYLYKSTIT